MWVCLIVYNRVEERPRRMRPLLGAAAERQDVRPDRISFIDALDALRHHGWRGAQRETLVAHRHGHNRDARHEPRMTKRRKALFLSKLQLQLTAFAATSV
jgi:hypothetical protein